MSSATPLMNRRSDGPSDKRSSLVDALRGVSILLVMLFHFDMYYHLRTSDLANSFGLGHVVTLITRNGCFGVTMFFVISGFLITSTSLRRSRRLQNISPLNFYWFRFGRSIFRFWSEPMNYSIRQVPNRLAPAGHDPAGQSKPPRSRPIDRRKDFRVGRL